MVTVKESIELLLRIFRSFGFSKLKAEMIRLAKFDDASSTQWVWRLLFESLYFCRYNTIDDVCHRGFEEFSSKEVVSYVKREMVQLGYLSRDFEHLDPEMATGSRELLLAFGWLMCREALIHRFSLSCVQPLFEHPESSDTDGELLSHAPLFGGHVTEEMLKQMVWLNGRMRMNLKQLHWMRREQVNADHEVHESTLGVSALPGRNHLTSAELYLLKHPDLLSKNLQLLEQDNERLQVLLKWRSCEDEFWQWMESVLDLKLQERIPGVDSDKESIASAKDVAELAQTEQRLSSTVEKYEGIVELLEQQWSLKALSVTRAEVDLMIRAVDAEIRSFSLYIMKQFTLPRFNACLSLQQPGPKERGRVRDNLEQLLPNAATSVEREVERLEGVLSKLESDVENNYAAFNDQIQALSQFTDSMVLQDTPSSL